MGTKITNMELDYIFCISIIFLEFSNMNMKWKKTYISCGTMLNDKECVTAVSLLLEMCIIKINVCFYYKQEWRQMKGYS